MSQTAATAAYRAARDQLLGLRGEHDRAVMAGGYYHTGDDVQTEFRDDQLPDLRQAGADRPGGA